MKNMIKITIYIIIITLLLQRLYNRQTINKANEIRQSILVSVLPYDCVFETPLYFFELPDCKAYKPGKIIKINASIDPSFGREDTVSDTGFFNKKGLIIESITYNQSVWSSPELWFEYIFYLFQTKTRLVLTDFLSLFDADDSYLIGQFNLGFSPVNSERVSHLFKVTGTQYLASISGYNLSLVVRFFTNSAKNFFGKWAVGIISLAVAGFYLLLVGNQIPLARAFLMLFFSVVSTSFLLRQNNPATALFLAALILFLTDISVISTISFQLSFTATASIIYFINRFKNFKNFQTNSLAVLHLSDLSVDDKPRKRSHTSGIISIITKYLVDSIKISIYVQIIVTPLVLYHFKEFSVISLIVSIALTWLVPGIIMLTFGLLFIYLLEINGILFRLFSLPLSFLSKIFLSILKLFDNQLFLVKVSYFPWWYVLIWWLIVLLVVQFITRSKRILHLVEFI
ncbi:MAG: hypothetical protein COZ34_02225 [Candidatus Pacebacteria bacterium CG_4_10_14_3_um_filter_34_15]|nr:ComEC/Rec2 family competence protein [Candidatus Pacearchaeota archaeon]NCQ66000.1 ComEC/Rec2 family competence protein [Candidatus Paceibacterota bacterium]OIO43751.1 MAG: hypothetical protein AUJ41_04360 [Candidatus Pacebacteria bacterium CG1_02_43_31]PIQ80602.1 MAG: hypothetical protein COV78_04710 [Candidatus Pacebacteria bacterium CG11_big_fil_rev_8_21_14_0_20_34_55]PIX81643.1 MAG: hypothetical protein COZ34_02225 [Candidatus Pacebacteria bacterium CG_4_10_14_3_um_filter_34_15]PJC43373